MQNLATAREAPQVYLIDCYKCTRQYELHGAAARLELALEVEGWINDGGRMICPRCPAPRNSRSVNKFREQARRAA